MVLLYFRCTRHVTNGSYINWVILQDELFLFRPGIQDKVELVRVFQFFLALVKFEIFKNCWFWSLISQCFGPGAVLSFGPWMKVYSLSAV